MHSNQASPLEDGKDAHPLDPASLKLHAFWNMEPVYIQVNKTIFVVPRDAFQGFSSSSNPFAEAGRPSPAVAVENIAGISKARPIVLDNVAEYEFESFLQVIYPFTLGLSEKPKLDLAQFDWEGVLRLSTLWNHEASRKQAVDALTKEITTADDAASMLRLGREHSIAQWTRSAYIALIRNYGIGLRELTKEPFECDWETIAKIMQARCDAVPKASSFRKPPRFCALCDEAYFDSSGALQICLCRATAMFEEYFPDFSSDAESALTSSATTNTFWEHNVQGHVYGGHLFDI